MATARNLDTASVVLLVGFLSWPFGAGKIVPGGPFISLFGDLIPALFAIVAIACAMPYVSSQWLKVRASAVAHIALATILLAVVCLSVAEFYLDSYSRGNAVGW